MLFCTVLRGRGSLNFAKILKGSMTPERLKTSVLEDLGDRNEFGVIFLKALVNE